MNNPVFLLHPVSQLQQHQFFYSRLLTTNGEQRYNRTDSDRKEKHCLKAKIKNIY